MSATDQVERELRKLIASKIEAYDDPSAIPMDVPLFQGGLGLDSMSGIELLTELEQRFDVYIDDDAFDVFDSLQNLVIFVRTNSKRVQD